MHRQGIPQFQDANVPKQQQQKEKPHTFRKRKAPALPTAAKMSPRNPPPEQLRHRPPRPFLVTRCNDEQTPYKTSPTALRAKSTIQRSSSPSSIYPTEHNLRRHPLESNQVQEKENHHRGAHSGRPTANKVPGKDSPEEVKEEGGVIFSPFRRQRKGPCKAKKGQDKIIPDQRTPLQSLPKQITISEDDKSIPMPGKDPSVAIIRALSYITKSELQSDVSTTESRYPSCKSLPTPRPWTKVTWLSRLSKIYCDGRF